MRGRDRELKVALEMVRAAQAGHNGMLLVEGEHAQGLTNQRIASEMFLRSQAAGKERIR